MKIDVGELYRRGWSNLRIAGQSWWTKDNNYDQNCFVKFRDAVNIEKNLKNDNNLG